jgi:hypothetical protein
MVQGKDWVATFDQHSQPGSFGVMTRQEERVRISPWVKKKMATGIPMRAFGVPVLTVLLLTGAQPALADCDVLKAMLARQGKALEEAWNDPSKLTSWKNASELKCTFHSRNNDRIFECVNDSAEYRTASHLYHNAAKTIKECTISIETGNNNPIKSYNNTHIYDNGSRVASYYAIYKRNVSYNIGTTYEYFYKEKRFVFRFSILYREK